MSIEENILNYLFTYGKENKYKLARALKTDVANVTKTLELLREEGIIEIKEGKAVPLKRKKPTIKKRKQKKQPTEEAKKPEEVEEEQKETKVSEEAEEKPSEEVKEGTESKEESEEEQKTDISEEPTEEVQETFGVKTEEEFTKEMAEGTVKFFNPNKGFGFITGDDGKEYYVNKDGLKEGVTIETDDKVSFKIVQGDRGPKAEEVEKINESVEENAS